MFAGSVRVALARRLGVSLDRRPARETGRFGSGGAPGSRIWQCGQWSGPDSIVRRHKGHVIWGTPQGTSGSRLSDIGAD